MKEEAPMPSPAVVVGIDGSAAAVTAALWAVDEAMTRDVPLRLMYAIEPQASPLSSQRAARDLATAEIAVREAFMAVESLDLPVKIEVEIVQDRPERALVFASRSATLVCVGALGRDHALGRRVGSVAATVSDAAYCPVAIIRRHDPRPAAASFVVAELELATDTTSVLECALQQARTRGVPVHVATTWKPRFADVHDLRAAADHNQLTRAQLEKRLAPWRRRFPDVEITPVVARGSILNYVAEHARSVQLLVVCGARSEGVADIAGAVAHGALHDTDCSVLICGRFGTL